MGLESPSQAISIHPNPHSDQFVIELPTVLTEVQAKVYDLTGKEVDRYDFRGQKTLAMEISGPQGVYFVHLEGDGLSRVLKVVKQSE